MVKNPFNGCKKRFNEIILFGRILDIRIKNLFKNAFFLISKNYVYKKRLNSGHF